MITAKICYKKSEDRLYWILSLSTIIKEKTHSKEFKGIEFNNEINAPFDTLLSAIKKDQEDIEIISNDINLITLVNDFQTNHNIKTVFDQLLEDEFNFEEMEDYSLKENPDIPQSLNQFNDKKYETDFENSIYMATKLFQTYMYFLEFPEKVHETNLIKKLKKLNKIPDSVLIEDIFSIIEDTLSEEV
jgi:hypothetical protein